MLILCVAYRAHTANYFWDTNPNDPTGTYTSGSGYWGVTNNTWQNVGGSHVGWPSSGNDNDAYITGGSGTITNTSDISLHNLSTVGATGTWNLYGNTGGATWTLDGFDGNFDVTNNATVLFGGASSDNIYITGTANIMKWGTGTLQFEGVQNSFVGNIYVNQGTFKFNADGSFGNPANQIYVDNGGKVFQNTSLNLTLTNRSVYIGSGGGLFEMNFNKQIILQGGGILNWTNNPNSNWTGPGTVTVDAIGTGGALVLQGTNTFSGQFILNNDSATLSILAAGNAGGAGVSLDNSATLLVTQNLAGVTMPMSSLTNLSSALTTTITFDFGADGISPSPVMYVTNLSPGNATCTINISGSGFIGGQFPLIQYQAQDGSLTGNSFVAGTMPDGFTGTIVTNPANSSIDVVLAYQATTANAAVVIQPEDQAQLITGWAFDIKYVPGYQEPPSTEAYGYFVTPSEAQTLFVTNKFNILRVPIWCYPCAHPAPGVVIGSMYADQLYAMTNARAANSNVVFFASRKGVDTNSIPAWCLNGNSVVGSEYAIMLGDYLQYIHTNGGFNIDVLEFDSEESLQETPVTPSTWNDTVTNLIALSKSQGFHMPLMVAPSNFAPDTNFMAGLVTNGWYTNDCYVSTHYYLKSYYQPDMRPYTSLVGLWLKAESINYPEFDTEFHWAPISDGDPIDQNEAGLAQFIDLADNGYSKFAWWNYTGVNNLGNVGQALTETTINSTPVTTTSYMGGSLSDSSGTMAWLGTFYARAYRSGTNLAVWVMNNTGTNGSPCNFSITSGNLIGPVTYTQWNGTGVSSFTGTASLSSPTNFSLSIGFGSIALVTVGYVPAGPMGYYALETNLLDGSGNNNNGTNGPPALSATNYVRGRVGLWALQFNGSNSYVQIPRSIGAMTNLTIAFWMKTTSGGGTGTNWWNGAGLVDGKVAANTNDFGVSLLNGNVAFGVGSPDKTLQSTIPVNDGQWHHVVVTRSGYTGIMTLYLDGEYNTNCYGPRGPTTAPPFLCIGSLKSTNLFFNGALDDVRLYGGLLDTDTIAELANAPSPGPVLGTISDQTLVADQTLNLTNNATDANVPPLVLNWSVGPTVAGLTINTNTGVVQWRPTIAQSPSTNALWVSVADNGTPSLSATQQFTVTVLTPVAPMFSTPQIRAGGLSIEISGNVGPDYTVQESSNLLEWTPILMTNPPIMPFTLGWPVSNNVPVEFYRIQLGP